MKLSSNLTPVGPIDDIFVSSLVSPQDSLVDVSTLTHGPDDVKSISDQDRVESQHLVDLALRSVGRPEVLTEKAIAWTVVTRPYISGTRGLARWSGVADKALRTLVGPNGQTSEHGYLWTRTRGVSSPTLEDREQMELRYSDTRTQNRSTPLNTLQPSSPSTLARSEGSHSPSMGNAVLSACISERAQRVLDEGMKHLSELVHAPGHKNGWSHQLLMLDPGLDLWAEYEGDFYMRDWSLGRRAWSLAVMCGLLDVTLSVADIEDLTGLSKRGVQALLKRMSEATKGLLVWKVRQGRNIVYEIKWASMFWKHGDPEGNAWYEDCYDRDEVRQARAARDMEIQATSARRGTPAGYLAYLHSTSNAKRDQYLADHPLPDNASEEYRALVAEGDEMALWEYFREQEQEAGPVPASPEALSASLPAPQEERAPEVPELSPEELEARQARLREMRARVLQR